MRQRLGVALAFLGTPEVVVLDEPTDGLDPEGVAAVRDVIKARVSQGATVLLSSHLLSEVETLAHRIIMLHHGAVIADTAVESFRQDVTTRLTFRSPEDGTRALEVLSRGGWRCRPEGTPSHLRVESSDGYALNATLAAAGIIASEITSVRPSLEQLILGLARQEALKA